MMVYIFDGTMDGLLTAVFDAFAMHEQPETKRLVVYGQDWRKNFHARP